MIINIRGTSGSGKSTIVRAIMDEFPTRDPDFIGGRKRPIGYICRRPARRSLYIMGHYEILCGGADTISDFVEQFDRINKAHELGYDVLCEGLFISGESNKMLELHKSGIDILVLGINLPLKDCYAAANRRKREIAESYGRPYRGDYNYQNVRKKHLSTHNSMKKLKLHGVRCEWHDRKGCLSRVKEELDLSEE